METSPGEGQSYMEATGAMKKLLMKYRFGHPEFDLALL